MKSQQTGSDKQPFAPVHPESHPPRFLPGTAVEIVFGVAQSAPPQHALFDFDGTLSLIREGWPEVMIPMMVDVLRAAGSGESCDELTAIVRRFVMELTGKQTIYQMIRLAEEVERRGGTPEPPLVYKRMYHERLMDRIVHRRDQLRTGGVAPADMLVPGSQEILAALADRGVTLYLASGTDQPYVVEEVRLLGLDPFFGPRVYGALDNYRDFSKAMVIDRILAENGVAGAALIGFGDGYVEIQNVKQAGGTAVAVASDESGRSGRPDPWKRERLIGVGADLVIPDFQDYRPLLDYLWGGGG